MAQDFFRIYKGLEVDEAVQMLSGSGVPSSADTDAAPVGSFYLDQTGGLPYSKITAGAGANKWQVQATQSWVQNYVATSTSWREPVVVMDAVSTTVPTGTASQTITVDGQTISNGGRVLFSAITGGNGKNVYVYNQTTGVFAEDVNLETTGDTVEIQSGTSAGKIFQFDGTNWGWIQSAGDTTEMANIRTFVGKGAAGATTPTYSSVTTVANADSLQTAVGKLDIEGSYIRTFIGKANGNSTPTYSSTNFVANTDSIQTAVGKLDASMGTALKQTSANAVTSVTTVDSVTAVVAEWDVYISEVATPTRVWAGKVMAVHNGSGVDHTVYSVLKLNGTITGLVAAVTVTGGNTLNLTVTSTSSVNVKAKRLTAIV